MAMACALLSPAHEDFLGKICNSLNFSIDSCWEDDILKNKNLTSSPTWVFLCTCRMLVYEAGP